MTSSEDSRGLRIRVYVAAFLCDAVGHAHPLVVSAFAENELGASPFWLGLLSSVTTAAYGLSCVPAGGWSDRRGSAAIIRLACLIILAVALPLAAAARSVAVLAVANAVLGLGLALFWPPIQRQLSLASPGPILWRSLGVFNLAWVGGAAVGAWAWPLAYDAWGYLPAMALSMLVLALTLAGTLLTRFPKTSAAAPAPPDGADPGVTRLFLGMARIANFSSSFAVGGLHGVFVHVSNRFGWGMEGVAWILGAREVGRLTAFTLCWRTAAWHHSLPWLALAQLAGGGALIACGFLRDPFVFGAFFFLAGFASGLAYYSSLYYGLNLRSDEGRRAGIHEGILAGGLFLGPLACGAAGEVFPAWPGAVMFFPGLALLAGLAAQLVLAQRGWKRTRRAARMDAS